MQYLRKSFSVPISSKSTEQQWDYSMMTKEEFKTKYKVSDEEYDNISFE